MQYSDFNLVRGSDARGYIQNNADEFAAFNNLDEMIPNDIPVMQGVEPSFSTYLNGVTTVDNYWTGANGRAVPFIGGGPGNKLKRRNRIIACWLRENK